MDLKLRGLITPPFLRIFQVAFRFKRAKGHKIKWQMANYIDSCHEFIMSHHQWCIEKWWMVEYDIAGISAGVLQR